MVWGLCMSDVVIFKAEDGKLQGLGEKGSKAWAKFQKAVRELEVGETLKFSWWAPRSPGLHRRHFAMLAQVFDSQEQFVDPEHFRMWVQVGAGFCDIVPGAKGKPVAIPKSIAWAKLDDVEFADHHAKVVEFLRSRHALRFLWPHIDDANADQMIDALLNDFM